MNIPKTHQAVMPYLIVDDASRLIDFAKKVFGATLNFQELRDDTKKIRHAEIQIDECTIMLADATEEFKQQTANLFIYVDDADTAYATALDNGATNLIELSDQEYGRTCGITDPVGNVWWITSVK
ncbi:MAG: VOC family protein [Ginsengibacter sp.]